MKHTHQDKIDIGSCTVRQYQNLGKRRPLGLMGYRIGILILLSYTFFIVPMFAFMWVCSRIYFWFYGDKPVLAGPYFNFDRHRIKYLSFWNKLGCEYCEFTNGALQWALAVANAIERKWCPIQNECDPNCQKVKEWRKDFLPFEHKPEDLEKYYGL